ncbi:MAG: ATP-binding protein [Pirellulales bacterium]
MTRTAFTVSRAAEFFSEKELQMQMGASRERWLPMLLKELIDNALDACEGAGALPCIEITATDDSISVSDNGPGIPARTVVASLDYLSRTSSNNLYVSPTRGQLGNALKCLYAAGFVTHGRGEVEISAGGILHRITVGFDEIRQEPTLEHDQQPTAHHSGTVVKTAWPGAASELGGSDFPVLQSTAVHFGLFNPHATFYLNGEVWAQPLSESDLTFSKWKPNRSSPASWYYRHQFKQLLCAHLAGQPQMYVREFIKLFAGMSGSWSQSAVLDDLKLQRTTITDAFTAGGEVVDAKVEALHDAIGAYSGEAIKAKRLGVIGRDLLERLADFGDVRPESTAYAKALVEDHSRPFVVECWFAAHSETRKSRILLLGINNSIVRSMPNELIRDALEDSLVDPYDPVTVAIHMVCPGFDYVDRGKSRIDFADDQATAITQVIEAACKKWKKVKARLRREERASDRELERLCKQRTVSVKEAAWAVMEQAYLKASGNGEYPANARQVMYAARGQIQELTGKPLSDQYFTQTLLPDFQAENRELTADWDVVYDNRGNLTEPHTRRVVPIGTVAVRNYVNGWCSPEIGKVNATVPVMLRTSGPSGRYSAAIFIEKEGFSALFAKAQTAELFDVAIFSTKGMSTTAARQLVDSLSAEGVPIFLLHDFDAAGMTIARTIQADGRRYQFANDLQVIDLGLRLEQAQAMELEPEEFCFPKRQKQDPRDNLVGCGATDEELAFLVQGQKGGGWYGQRIELNAMTAPQFVEFVHSQLEAHGIEKVVPDDDDLAAAYQHVRRRDALMKKVEDLLQQAETESEDFTTPDDLADRVRELIEGTTDSWEDAIKRLARETD